MFSNVIFFFAIVLAGGLFGILMSWICNHNEYVDDEVFWIGAWLWTTSGLAFVCSMLWVKAGGFIGFM